MSARSRAGSFGLMKARACMKPARVYCCVGSFGAPGLVLIRCTRDATGIHGRPLFFSPQGAKYGSAQALKTTSSRNIADKISLNCVVTEPNNNIWYDRLEIQNVPRIPNFFYSHSYPQEMFAFRSKKFRLFRGESATRPLFPHARSTALAPRKQHSPMISHSPPGAKPSHPAPRCAGRELSGLPRSELDIAAGYRQK